MSFLHGGRSTIAIRFVPTLSFWQEKNHNGILEPDELHSFSDFGLGSIALGYKEDAGWDKR